MSCQKGARSKLADVLADIKNSRSEDNHDSSTNEVAPPPNKRRVAVNYVALSGHTPRQRSSNNNNSASNTNNTSEHKTNSTSNTTNAPSSAARSRTYVLRLFDRTVDLAQFTGDNSKGEDTPLYPICREWIHSNHQKTKTLYSSKSPTKAQPQSKSDKPTNGNSPQRYQPQDQYVNETVDTEVHSLPPCRSKIETIKQFKLMPTEEDIDIRIPPSVRQFKIPENVEETIDKAIYTLDREQCLMLNKKRWKRVKDEWKEARRVHESRYRESFKVLEDLCMT